LLILPTGFVFGQGPRDRVLIDYSRHSLFPTNQDAIIADAIALLKTSNWNSLNHLTEARGAIFPGGIPGVQSRYRRELNGSYVVITFSEARHFALARGKGPTW